MEGIIDVLFAVGVTMLIAFLIMFACKLIKGWMDASPDTPKE